ncbi:MAG: chloride channel protein [Bacteroidales bacterium]|jgi:CIC family chloride channel protein|nr:chloride channel protein [Bacteroidales bacterium]
MVFTGKNRLKNDLKQSYKGFMLWKIKYLSERQTMIVLSFIVGIFCGLASVILKNVVHFTYLLITDLSWFSKSTANILFLAYPMIGITLTIFVIKYFIKDDLSHGVSKVLYAISMKKGKMKRHNCYSSMFTSSLTVAFGGSVGLEAPIVLTGSAIASNIGSFFRVNYKCMLTLLGCGAAGAIAGVFKAPIAGILFVFEVLMLDLTMSTAIPLLISAISAAMISYFFLGQDVEFFYKVTTPFELQKIIPFMILGIISAVISLYFLKINKWVAKIFKAMKQWEKILIGGSILGVLVYLFPPLFGEGYSALRDLLSNNTEHLLQNSFFFDYRNNTWLILGVLLAIIFLKAFATSVTLSSGGVGGTFAPSLFIGGFVGFFVAKVINMTGLIVVAESNFALVGMAAVMAGVMHAPLTATFLIAEITGGYALFAPLMIATTVSYVVLKPFAKYSIYTETLAKQGALTTHDKNRSALQFMNKNKIIEYNFVKLYPDEHLRDIVKAVEVSSRNIFPVVEKDDTFLGIVVLDDIRHLLFKPEFYNKYKVTDFMRYSPLFIADLNDSMEKIINKFRGSDRYTIIITDNGKFVGAMTRANVFAAYQRYMQEISEE